MPNKTVYLKSPDVPIWEQARQVFGGSISAIVIDCLKVRLAEKAAESITKMTKIRLPVTEGTAGKPVIQSFTGRWLVGNAKQGVAAEAGGNWPADQRWAVAQTAKGRLVVYCTSAAGQFEPFMEVFDNFADFSAAKNELGAVARYPQGLKDQTQAALQLAYELELDI